MSTTACGPFVRLRIIKDAPDHCRNPLALFRRSGTEKGRRSDPPFGLNSANLFGAFDLFEFEFDRRCSSKDRDADLHAAAVEVEFLDDAVEAGERAV